MKDLLNKLNLMDCMEGMKQFPDNYFDLAIVDPPYGINLAEWDNKTPDKIYFNELFRISKNQIIWGGNYFADKLPVTESWICWHKKPFLLQQAHFELAWTSFDMKPKLIDYTYAGNAEGQGQIRVNYKKKSIHPAQKPVNIYKLLLQNYAKKGDLILDTHVGSGSSLIACIEEGFNYCGFEIDKDYFNAAQKRINEVLEQGRLFTA